MVFAADDLGAWSVGSLADAGREKLTTWVLGSNQERALRQAAPAAIESTARRAPLNRARGAGSDLGPCPALPQSDRGPRLWLAGSCQIHGSDGAPSGWRPNLYLETSSG